MADKTPIARLEDVTKYYEDEKPVLDSCRLSVEAGESIAIVGPSGSGKSTLLNLTAALDAPTSGRVLIEGMDTAGLSEDELAALRNRKIGFVFQLHHLLDQCTVAENVLLPALPSGGADKDLSGRAQGLLDRVGLADKTGAFPSSLSGGERQRVAVVRALINRPLLVLADEPTGSLDRETAAGVADLLVELHSEQETALVVVTHSEQIAARMSRVLHLRSGKLHRGDG